jgi:serine/threonine protein phosphatase PrpC
MRIKPYQRQTWYHRYSLAVPLQAILLGCLVIFPKQVLSLSPSSSSSAATSATSASSSGAQNEYLNATHAGGRFLFSADIIFDDSIRVALKHVRYPHDIDGTVPVPVPVEHKDEAQAQEQQEALQQLQVTGNADRLTLTLRGYKGVHAPNQPNQDRGFVWQSSRTSMSTSSTSSADENSLLMVGVLDGHGSTGHHIAEYARGELIHQLGMLLLKEGDDDHDDHDSGEIMQEDIRQAFLRVDESIPRDLATGGGATVSIVLRRNDTLFVANAGDSQSLIAAVSTSAASSASAAHAHAHADTDIDIGKTRVTVLYASRLDKPDHPEERARILEAGGIVSEASKYDDARVSYQHNGRTWGLAMSRGLGDAAAIGVTAEPIVDVFSIAALKTRARKELQEMCRTVESSPSFSTAAFASSETDGTCTDTVEAATVDDDKDIQLFVVSATDGMIDYFEPTDLARIMGAAFYDRATDHPLKAAENLIHAAAKEWQEEMEGEYRDDITISAAKIL